MYSQNDLDDAVAAGAVSAESAAALRAYIERSRSTYGLAYSTWNQVKDAGAFPAPTVTGINYPNANTLYRWSDDDGLSVYVPDAERAARGAEVLPVPLDPGADLLGLLMDRHVVLAADVLYERKNAAALADLVPQLLTPGGEVIFIHTAAALPLLLASFSARLGAISVLPLLQ